MINIIKKKIKSSNKLYVLTSRFLNHVNSLNFIFRFVEIFINYIRVIFHKKVHFRSENLLRSSEQKKDIKKILLNQVTKFKKNSEKKEPFVVLEIGSLIGDNIEFIGDILDKKLKFFLIISVDPYEDYINNFDKKNYKSLKFRSNYTNLLYKYFLHNNSLLKYRKNIFHLRDYSSNALNLLKKLMIKFDFIYIDGSHYYKNIKEDFLLSKEIIKKKNKYKGVICGDDFTVHIDDHRNFNLSKIKFAKLLKKNINRELIALPHFNKDGFGKTEFHSGITLFFSQISDKITKKRSGIWNLDQK